MSWEAELTFLAVVFLEDLDHFLGAFRGLYLPVPAEFAAALVGRWRGRAFCLAVPLVDFSRHFTAESPAADLALEWFGEPPYVFPFFPQCQLLSLSKKNRKIVK